ncbi:hypothetical protein [Arenimonas composti]|uniref:Uncharacterized protein n=1 Tax=Arenimonas composti TR7-09 = DSM 18010 TaxID=1121013 RepID=A0A091C1I0_9GAMM|nr:hypothetical protein [Arenimonas composti]KFN50460.1 hypothetical protein P873_07295 [Arenimonas composti TR7-09 = DSM 18010]
MKTLNDFYRLFPSRPATRPELVPSTTVLPEPERSATPANEPVLPMAARYRRREIGTGYGRSSGYAQDRSYVRGRGDDLLRVG